MPLSLHTPGSSKTSQGQSHGREGKNARFALLLPLCAAVTRTAETVQEGAPPHFRGACSSPGHQTQLTGGRQV